MKAAHIWTIRPQARPEAVVQGKDYRITVLTDRLLRLEYAENGSFRDTASQMALCREFPVPAFTVTEDEKGLTVETDALRLRYDRQPFSYQGLTVEVCIYAGGCKFRIIPEADLTRHEPIISQVYSHSFIAHQVGRNELAVKVNCYMVAD